MFEFLKQEKKSLSMAKSLDELENTLVHDLYRKYFALILTNRGIEFQTHNLFSFSIFMLTITSTVIVTLIKNVGKPTFIFTDFLHFILPFTFIYTHKFNTKRIFKRKNTIWDDEVLIWKRNNRIA